MATGLFTLPFNPSYSINLDEAPRTRTAEYGEGYVQRSGDGLNSIQQMWSGEFGQRNDQDALDLLAFFRMLGGVTPFYWVVPSSAYSVTSSGFGIGDGVRTNFQLWRPGITGPAGVISDWSGAWPLYTTQRTNYLLWSQDFTNAAWLKIGGGTGSLPVVTGNYGYAPDGTLTADRIQFALGAGNTINDYCLVRQSLAATAPTGAMAGARSFWVKSNTGTTQYVEIHTASSESAEFAIGTTWQQIFFNEVQPFAVYAGIGKRGTTSLTTPNADILVWQAQCETAAAPTRPIVTTSAIVTVQPTYSVAGGFGISNYLAAPPTIYQQDWEGTQQLYPTLRTNWLTYSDQFDNAAWTKYGGQVLVQAASGPSTQQASFIQEDTSTGNHGLAQTIAGLPDNAVISAYWDLKKGTRTLAGVFVRTKANNFPTAVFDLNAGTISSSGGTSFISASITPMPNGFYRCQITANVQSGATVPTMEVYSEVAAGTSSRVGDGASGLYASEAQYEVNPTSTSYIQSLGTAGTSTDYSVNNTGLVTVASSAAPIVAAFLGTGNGSTAIYTITTPNGTTPTSVRVFRNDWQGNQLMYPTARTNMILQSADVSNGSWGKVRLTATGASIVAPDGTTTGSKLVEDATASASRYCNTSAWTATAQPYTFSIFMKAGTRTIGWLSLDGTNAVWFDLSGGTVTSQNAGCVGTIKSVGSGWYKCTITQLQTSGAKNALVGPAAVSGSYVYTGDGASYLYTWGGQVEAGPLSTSYLATTTVAATITDYTLAGSTVTFYTYPLTGAALTWSGYYTSALSAGVQLLWTGSGSVRKQFVAVAWKRGFDDFNRNKVTAQLREDFS
jgi:phage-related protein